MIKKPVIGISGCLAGSAVRFDGGHKRGCDRENDRV